MTAAATAQTATAALWERLARPRDPVRALSAFAGCSVADAARQVGVSVATSDEAEDLLSSFGGLVRSLATAMGTHPERCTGELRGPVLWSETLSARASSFGDPDLFVCSTPARAYDIDENRVLVYALESVSAAASRAVIRTGTREWLSDPVLERAARNGQQAGRYARHPSLKGVRRGKPTPRELKRTRSGKKRYSYRPALNVLSRASDPVDAEELAVACDRRTQAQHEVVAAVLRALERAGAELPPLRVEDGQMYAGPVQYRHRFHAGPGRPAGIVIGEMLLDVPGDGDEAALEARAGGGRPCALVRSIEDIDRAVSRAIDLARA